MSISVTLTDYAHSIDRYVSSDATPVGGETRKRLMPSDLVGRRLVIDGTEVEIVDEDGSYGVVLALPYGRESFAVRDLEAMAGLQIIAD